MTILANHPWVFWTALAVAFPLLSAILLRHCKKPTLSALGAGTLSALGLSGYALFQVDLQGEMEGYSWLLLYTPISAVVGFIGGALCSWILFRRARGA